MPNRFLGFIVSNFAEEFLMDFRSPSPGAVVLAWARFPGLARRYSRHQAKQVMAQIGRWDLQICEFWDRGEDYEVVRDLVPVSCDKCGWQGTSDQLLTDIGILCCPDCFKTWKGGLVA